ncbi:MAG TPA: DMT family transporter [Bacillaceae bacterium]
MLKAYAWLIFCVVVWGSNFVFGKLLVRDFSPAMLTMLRLLFIVFFLIVLSLNGRKMKPVSKTDVISLFFLGVIGVFINQWSFFAGLETADSTTSALILATTPIVTGLLAAVFLKESITLRMLIGSTIAIAGIYFVVTEGDLSSVHIDKGLWWIVVTMITFAIMIIMTRQLSQRLEPLVITLYSNIVGFIISIPFAFVLDNPLRISYALSNWALLIGTAVIVHAVATLIWNKYIRYVDASKASILSNLEPFVAMITGLVLLAKPITGAEMLGSLFIVGGVILSTYQLNHKLEDRRGQEGTGK